MSGLVLNTNMESINTHRNLTVVSDRQTKASEKLSSGFKINRAGDDAAGLAISEKMRNQIVGLRKASANVNEAWNLFATGDGALGELAEMAGRIRELAVSSMNDTNMDEDRIKMNEEVQQLITEFNETCLKTEYNTYKVLAGEMITIAITNAIASRYAMETADNKNIIEGITFPATNSSGNVTASNRIYLNCDGYRYGVLLDEEVQKYDSNFFNFLANDMYEADGSVSAANLEHFRSVLEKALNSGIRSAQTTTTPSTPPSKYPTVIVEYSPDGKLVIATEEGLLFDVYSGGCSPGNNTSFGHQFLHLNFNSSTVAFTIGKNDYSDKQLYVQMGANTGQGHLFEWKSCSSDQAGLTGTSVATRSLAQMALESADTASKYVVDIRTKFGSYMNRLEHTEKNLDISAENLCGAESRIRDTDMALEMMEFTKSGILAQAGLSMLSQANQNPRNVLSILQ